MKPGPAVFVTVTFKETAEAVPGMPHWPDRVKFRGTPALNGGAPYRPAGPRVSAIRQGFKVWKGVGLGVELIIPSPPDLAGLRAGTAQLSGGSLLISTAKRLEDARTRTKKRTDFL